MRRFRTTKIIKVEQLVIVIEVEQVSALEDANIDKFTRFQTFVQIAIIPSASILRQLELNRI